MKYYITLLIFLSISLCLAQSDCKAILKSVNTLQNQTIAQMKKNTNKAKNDTLFEQFYKEAYNKLSAISTGDTYELPTCLQPYVDENTNTFTPEFQKLLDNYGLIDVWNGGFIGFYFQKDYLNNTFKNYLSEEMLLYLKTTQIRPFMYADAALIMSWKELGVLVFNESTFIKKFPNSKKIAEVKENYTSDVTTFIFGIDNTPSSEIPEARKAMKTFVKQYPQALATPIVNLYLEKTKNLVNKQGNIVKHDEYQKLGLQELITKQIKKQVQ